MCPECEGSGDVLGLVDGRMALVPCGVCSATGKVASQPSLCECGNPSGLILTSSPPQCGDCRKFLRGWK